MTYIAEPIRTGPRPSLARMFLLLCGLALFAAQTPLPWGSLWLLIPASVALSILVAWRFGAWGVLVPVGLFTAAIVIEGPDSLWVWWIPASALTGVWMGLREEGGGPSAGEQAWMLLPPLLLAAGVPWTAHFPELLQGVDREMRIGDTQFVELARQFGSQGERLKAIERAVAEHAKIRVQVLPHLLPSALFLWVAILVAAGRSIASRIAWMLKWPLLSRARLQAWRLPDPAVWVLLAGLGMLVAQWRAGAATAWTLLLNAGLGYCIQGIAVVESLLLARGVPPSIIVLTMLFVFTIAMPVFMLTTVAVGLSDVWLDYRRMDPSPNSE